MNYLAHFFLAENDDEFIIGNFLGDFVKGKLTDQYSPGILKGIVTHRKVDAFTDAHERVKACKRLISRGRRRYGGIIIDVFFDHFLSVKWGNYSDENLDEFIKKIYSVMLKYKNRVPDKVKILIPKMIENDWLSKYSEEEGLAIVFNGISKRVKRKNPLAGSEKELYENYKELEENFELFFPQLIEFAERVKRYL